MDHITLKQFEEILNKALANVVTKDDAKEFATKDDLKKFATKDDLKRFATKDDLKQFITKEDAKQFTTKDDLKNLATKDDLKKLGEKVTEDICDTMTNLFAANDEIKVSKEDLAQVDKRVTKIEKRVFN